MDDNFENDWKSDWLPQVNLGYKHEYEFGNGIECFDFVKRVFNLENVSAVEDHKEINNLTETSCSGTNRGVYNCERNERTDFETEINLNKAGRFSLEESVSKLLFEDIQDVSNLNNIELIFENYENEANPNWRKMHEKLSGNSNQRNISNKDKRIYHVSYQLKKYVCPLCEETFTLTQSDDFLSHYMFHLTEDSTDKADGKQKPERFPCILCSKIFRNKYNLRTHLDNAHVLKKCSFCEEIYLGKDNLKNHVTIHWTKNNLELGKHLQDLDYNSETEEFEQKYEAFVKKVENKTKYCEENENYKKIIKRNNFKTFSRNYNVMKHIKNTHSNQKDFKCKVCKKAFASNYHLHRHLTIHTVDRKYHCNVCSQIFRESIHFTNHIMKAHVKKLIHSDR